MLGDENPLSMLLSAEARPGILVLKNVKHPEDGHREKWVTEGKRRSGRIREGGWGRRRGRGAEI
jgi:hypothetical protein